MTGKSAVGSVSIVSAVVVLITQVALLLGYSLTDSDQQVLRDLINNGVLTVTTLISMGGAIGAIWGRWKATKQITSVLPQGKPQ